MANEGIVQLLPDAAEASSSPLLTSAKQSNAGAKKSVFVINILALSFAHNALATIKLDTFWTGLILLSGLFFYDIWWVFGTEVVSYASP